MTDNNNLGELTDSPTVEVRAYRQGELFATELCLTIEEAAALVESLEETPGVSCEITDLSASGVDETAAEVEAGDVDTGYSHGFESQA